jgi:hypothetical protein
MTKQVKKKPRGPAKVVVSPVTEWTDYLGVLELFGLRRSTAYHLDNEGLIQSVSLRQPGEKRGKRLFNVPSIRRYLNSRIAAEVQQ